MAEYNVLATEPTYFTLVADTLQRLRPETEMSSLISPAGIQQGWEALWAPKSYSHLIGIHQAHQKQTHHHVQHALVIIERLAMA